MQSHRPLHRSLVFASLLALTACDSSSPPADAGPDADTDAASGPGLGCGDTTAFPDLSWSHSTIGVTPGTYRDVYVEFARDCYRDVDITLSASADGIVDVPASVHVSPETARANVRVTGVAEGTVTLTATALHDAQRRHGHGRHGGRCHGHLAAELRRNRRRRHRARRHGRRSTAAA